MTAVWSQAGKSGGSEQAVAAREQQWLQSQKTNNPDLLTPLLADEMVSTLSDGKVVGKAGVLATAKSTKWSSVDYTDVKVKVYGGTAIATGNYKASGTDEAGKPFKANERWTDVWMKMPSGEWQCIASQDTPVKE
jgi:hypothetical protein